MVHLVATNPSFRNNHKLMTTSSIRKTFPHSVEELWNIVTDNTNYAWRSDLSKIKIIDDNHFVEYTKNNFPTHFTITIKRKYEEYELCIENANIKGRWIGLFKKLPNGDTELNFTEEIETTGLIMKLLAKPYLKAQQKRYLKNLEKRLKEVASEV